MTVMSAREVGVRVATWLALLCWGAGCLSDYMLTHGSAPGCGPGAAAAGEALWLNRYGDASKQHGKALVVDSTGSTIVTGDFLGDLALGGSTISKGERDIFLAKLDCAGSVVWRKRFGDNADQAAFNYLAIDDQDNVYFVGRLVGTIDFGKGALTSAGSVDVFVAKFDPAGELLWRTRFGGPGTEMPGGRVAVTADGGAVVFGTFTQDFSFGGHPLVVSEGADLFVAKLTASGDVEWAESFPGSGDQDARAVAVAANDDILLHGSFDGDVTFDQKWTALGDSATTNDIFLARLDASGAPLWSKHFGTDGDEQGSRVTIDADGSVLIGGTFSDTLDLGGGPLGAAGGGWIARLDADGNHLASRSFGVSSIGALALDAEGNILVGGDFYGTVSFGDQKVSSNGGADLYVLKLPPALEPTIWSQTGGGTDDDSTTSVAADPAGNVAVTGWFRGDVVLGGAPITSAGEADLFVGKLSDAPAP